MILCHQKQKRLQIADVEEVAVAYAMLHVQADVVDAVAVPAIVGRHALTNVLVLAKPIVQMGVKADVLQPVMDVTDVLVVVLPAR